jgi:hypothetical protein
MRWWTGSRCMFHIRSCHVQKAISWSHQTTTWRQHLLDIIYKYLDFESLEYMKQIVEVTQERKWPYNICNEHLETKCIACELCLGWFHYHFVARTSALKSKLWCCSKCTFKITRIKINKAKATFTGRRPRTHPSRTPRRHQTSTWSGHKGERGGTCNMK